MNINDALLNGTPVTRGVLFNARAITIANMLIRLGVNPSRIVSRPGRLFNDPLGRFVGVQVR